MARSRSSNFRVQPDGTYKPVRSKKSSNRTALIAIGAVVSVICAIALASPLRTLFASSNSSLVVGFSNGSTTQRWNVTCDEQYEPSEGCTPRQCARVLRDGFASEDEVASLRAVAERVMRYGGGSGGPTIFELHSGALSKGENFVDLYTALKNKGKPSPLTDDDKVLLHSIIGRVKDEVVRHFDVSPDRVWLASPTFISRISSGATARTLNDEYWHEHVDRLAYGSFVYSSLIYLSDYGVDFQGGEFVFVDKESSHTILPAKGRFHLFTSGSENVHYVAKVTSGVRYAFTIAFTCDQAQAAPEFLSKADF